MEELAAELRRRTYSAGLSAWVNRWRVELAISDAWRMEAQVTGTEAMAGSCEHSPAVCPDVSACLDDSEEAAVWRPSGSWEDGYGQGGWPCREAHQDPGPGSEVVVDLQASGPTGAGADVEPDERRSRRSGTSVWIIGHSFIQRAAQRAESYCYSPNLSLSPELVTVYWMRIEGQHWDGLPNQLRLKCAQYPQPDIIIIHLGGNDIGKEGTIDLLFLMKRDMVTIHQMFPNTKLVFSEIVPRLVWLQATHLKFCERIRKRLNRGMAKFMPSIGGFSFRHSDLEDGVPSLYLEDMIHLSDIGLEIFNLNLQEMIETAIGEAGSIAWAHLSGVSSLY
ncbi:uncharacterized protein [Dendropsophus ebraccatus]|uniref:uncharacterized protein isoform X2 n=1 Tax=Dendropsophus ebraccatus TaxID=150705 RepID=UPI003831C72D